MQDDTEDNKYIDSPLLLPLTPGTVGETDLLDEDVSAPPSSPISTSTQEDRSTQRPSITIDDRTEQLFITAAEMLHTVVQDQSKLYEAAGGGRHIPTAMPKIAPLILPALRDITITAIILQGQLCTRCNSRYVFKQCVRLRLKQISRMFHNLCVVCFVLERLESCDSVAVLTRLREISTMTLNCDCHRDTMLVALSSILVLGGDNTRRLIFTVIVQHVLRKLPSLFTYESTTTESGRATVRRLGDMTRKIVIIASTLTKHLFVCLCERCRFVRYVICVSGQSKSWLGYSALLAAAIGYPLLTESTDYKTIDELVNKVLADSKTSASVLQTTTTATRYDCVVCDIHL